MDPRRFEELSRRVGAAADRRAAVKALLAVVAAPALLKATADEAGAIPIVNCKAPGKKCSSDRRCCSGSCKKNRCSCKKKGKSCWAPLEGALCCSQRCQGGKCS